MGSGVLAIWKGCQLGQVPKLEFPRIWPKSAAFSTSLSTKWTKLDKGPNWISKDLAKKCSKNVICVNFSLYKRSFCVDFNLYRRSFWKGPQKGTAPRGANDSKPDTQLNHHNLAVHTTLTYSTVGEWVGGWSGVGGVVYPRPNKSGAGAWENH